MGPVPLPLGTATLNLWPQTLDRQHIGRSRCSCMELVMGLVCRMSSIPQFLPIIPMLSVLIPRHQ